jgi:hypothetical protein
MKSLGYIFFVVLFFSACTTDFQLEGEWRDIPVVYGFIAVSDTAHYVRVEKAFLEPGGDASQIAQIPDSLYYQNATVQLKNLETGAVYDLERVDGNEEGYPREEGIFASTPNYLYKIKAEDINLLGGEAFQILINTGSDEDLVTADTRIIEAIEPSENLPNQELALGDYDRVITTRWDHGEETKIFDLRWVIRYEESIPGTEDFEDKSIEWVLDRRLINDENRTKSTHRLTSGEFYQFLGSAIPENPDVVRKNLRIDISIVGGGAEFLEYLTIADANLGITSSNQIPVYTNLSRGYGIFTSRGSALREGLFLNSIALDSLETGIYTKLLNFN